MNEGMREGRGRGGRGRKESAETVRCYSCTATIKSSWVSAGAVRSGMGMESSCLTR